MLATRGKVLGVVSRGPAALAALSISAVLLVAACGHNDSTASSTPTLKTSTTTATLPPPRSAAPAPQPPQPGSAEAQAPAPAPVAPEERPLPVQSVTPSDSPKVTAQGQAFIDEVRKHGLSPSPDVAIPTADFVCQGKAQNMPADQLVTYVNAMVGSDPAFDPQKMPVEQAGKIYIDAATSNYCGK